MGDATSTNSCETPTAEMLHHNGCAVAFLLLAIGPTSCMGIDAYFGDGCFWGRQHNFIQFKLHELNRSTAALTAIAGYAGGAAPGASSNDVCYGFNQTSKRRYATLGHAEVEQVRGLTEEQLAAAARSYFSTFMSIPGTSVWTREDYFDQGVEY